MSIVDTEHLVDQVETVCGELHDIILHMIRAGRAAQTTVARDALGRAEVFLTLMSEIERAELDEQGRMSAGDI